MNEFKNYSVNILRTEEKFGYLSLSQFKNYSVNILLKEVYLLRLGFLDLKTTQLIFYKFQPNNVLTHSIFKNYSVNILQETFTGKAAVLQHLKTTQLIFYSPTLDPKATISFI